MILFHGNVEYRFSKAKKANLETWFASGVPAVGIKLISKKLVELKDYNTIEKNTKKVLKIINSIKK